MLRTLPMVLLLLVAAPLSAAAPLPVQEIVFRHSLTGETAALLVELVGRYNTANKTGKVMLQHVSMVEDLRQLPHIALLDDDEYGKFFDGRPRMVPLHKVMADAKQKMEPRRFYPAIADVVDDFKGRIQALPLAQSVPMLFYDKEAFRKVGLDPEQAPKTWWEVQKAAGKLFDAGYRCPYTSSSMAWVQIENLATQHSEPIVNRERGGNVKLALNGMVQVKHIALLSSWYKSNYFHYFGPGREADAKFAAGTCSMLTSDSSFYARLARAKSGEIGIAELPHYDDVRGVAPGRILPDGQALWVLAGKKAPEYKAVARFIGFMLRDDVQRDWVAGTGYLPMMKVTETPGTAEAAPAALRIVTQRLSDKKWVTGARPKGTIGLARVRAILQEELEEVWANRKPAKEALDTAVLRGNVELRPAPKDVLSK